MSFSKSFAPALPCAREASQTRRLVSSVAMVLVVLVLITASLVSSATSARACAPLKQLGLSQLCNSYLEQGLEAKQLCSLEKEDFDTLGWKLGARKKIEEHCSGHMEHSQQFKSMDRLLRAKPG